MTKLIAAVVLSSSVAIADDSTIAKAQTAYVEGRFEESIELARTVTATEGEAAWRLIGVSSCFLDDKAQAAEAFGHLSRKNQSFVRYVCHRSHIEL
jgi:hypothetical protein